MIRQQFSSEWLKARSGRALRLLAVLGVAIIALSDLGTVSSTKLQLGVSAAANPAMLSHYLIRNSFALVLFAAIFGAMSVTGEFRVGAIGRAVLVRPQRLVIVGAKALIAAVVGLGFGVLSVASGLLTAWFALGSAIVLDQESIEIITGLLAVNVFAAIWGAAIGWLIRNQAAAVVSILIWMLVAEPALIRFAPDLGKFLPGNVMGSLYHDTNTHLLAPLAAGAMLVAWALGLSLLGQRFFARRDVP